MSYKAVLVLVLFCFQIILIRKKAQGPVVFPLEFVSASTHSNLWFLLPS